MTKILEVFQNPNEELLDDIVKYLENEGIEITRESDEIPSEMDLMMENINSYGKVF